MRRLFSMSITFYYVLLKVCPNCQVKSTEIKILNHFNSAKHIAWSQDKSEINFSCYCESEVHITPLIYNNRKQSHLISMVVFYAVTRIDQHGCISCRYKNCTFWVGNIKTLFCENTKINLFGLNILHFIGFCNFKRYSKQKYRRNICVS